MCILPHATFPVPAARPAAHALPVAARQQLALDALTGHSISELARDHDVSRKFVYQQAATAQVALGETFAPQLTEDQVLFHLPVTKAWLQQATLGLILIGHSSYRGVVEFFRDLLGVP